MSIVRIIRIIRVIGRRRTRRPRIGVDLRRGTTRRSE